jgi:hypothetical protein
MRTLPPALLDQADARTRPFVSREPRPHRIEQPAVDLVDDLEMARQDFLKPRHRPFLQRFGQQRVVRVPSVFAGEVPGLIPAEVCASSSRMRISSGTAIVGCVSLSWMATFSGKLPIELLAAETAHQVGQRTGHQEIFLHEAQPLPRRWLNRRDRARA